MSRKPNSLTASALAAALFSHNNAQLHEIADIPTAKASQKSYLMPLQCQYTGIVVGSLTLTTVAGYLPMLSHWKQQQVSHPVFSLGFFPLLKLAKNSWLRFCGFSAEEAEDAVLTSKQEQLLQVVTLALLHQLTDVRQEVLWLPSFLEASNNWQSLMNLCYWKANLDSTRFRFPALRLSKFEREIDLRGFLQACWDAKKAYESTVREREEAEALRTAEEALSSISDELAGKRPKSSKLLWKWFISNLPVRYERDVAGWMKDLYHCKGDDIFEFTMADIDLFEEIFLSECPVGTSVSHAFLSILRSKRELLSTHFQAFEILIPDELQLDAAAGVIAADEPLLSDFPTKVKWIIAHAKWKLTHGSSSTHRDAAIKKQQQTTVHASFRPVPGFLARREAELEAAELEADDGSDLISNISNRNQE